MDRKKLLIRMALLILFIFIVNYVAVKFYWYSFFWYFDIPMHFLGGFWLGLALLWVFYKQNPENQNMPHFSMILKVIFGVFIVGMLWEFYEILVNDSFAKNPFNILDTASDICFDLAGGFLSVFYFKKRIMHSGIADV